MANNVTTPSTTHQGNYCDLYAHHNTARILMPMHYSLVFIIGLVGNLLALVVIVQNRKKINSTTLYSTNLVISDILFTTALPTRIAYYALGFDWKIGDALCRVSALVFYINTYAGVNFMTCLSIDRFFAVVHPLRYNKIKRIEYAKGVCIFVWVLVFAQTLPLLINPMSKQEAGRTTCMEYPNFEETDSLPWILLGACFLGYVLPLLIILICYSQICYKLFRTAKRNPLTEKSGVNKKALNTIIFIIVVFVLCFTPYHVAIIQHMVKKLRFPHLLECSQRYSFQISLHITVCLMNFNCCMDPFIYFFACKGYKRKVMKMLKRQVSVSISSAVRSAPDENSREMTESQIMIHSKSSNGK
ncbi:G-protein coupled receptor 183 [Perognathus longimembris pacificus]|uniref:G-protein coupled receptor 183 n=1 Tax=Perognathus longimembris pacificus TaxID=214514 RepID=UPI002019E380|nr:G-protein coupled receptor 183 [Perognathus longimembris pacificus]XP_048197097.1 G-protein coupled receptor 183 [Perognathus longimembris pacificus]XP_048197098.1 G-protein coupled receptor 183 [Perognathus longimembris pacificus]